MWKLVSFIVLLLAIGASIAFSVQQSDPVIIETATVTQGDISTSIEVTGRVINDQTVTLTALLDGELIDVQAREGNIVEIGAVLARLDNRHAVAQRDKARAELAFQQQAVLSAQTNYDRINKVSREGNTSRQARDDSLMKLRSVEAQLKIAESELVISELQLENAEIRAPFAGTVIEQTVETGQWVEAGTKLFTLVAIDGNVVEAQVDAGDSSEIRLGQNATLGSEAWPGNSWTSNVSWIAPAVTRQDNNPTNTFAVRLQIAASSPKLMLGEQLDVELQTELRNDVLLLPVETLTETAPGQYTVLIVEGNPEEGVARQVSVEVGLQSITHAQIISGLNEGDAVILPTVSPVQNGMSVTVR